MIMPTLLPCWFSNKKGRRVGGYKIIDSIDSDTRRIESVPKYSAIYLIYFTMVRHQKKKASRKIAITYEEMRKRKEEGG